MSTENPYPPVGGHHIRTYNVLRILAERHRIFFIGFAQNKEELVYVEDLKELCETVDVYPIPKTGLNPGFLYHVIRNLFSRLPLTAERFFIPEARERVRRLLSDGHIDMVHIDMLALARYHELLHGVPSVLTNHNVESLRLYRWMHTESNIIKKAYLYLQYLKLRAFEKEACPRFEHCIVVSEDDKQHLIDLCSSDNFVVVPNGVDIDYFKPLKENVRENHLIWVGGMSGPYNSDAVDFFLDNIWPVVKNENPGVTMDFIGKKPTRRLQEQAAADPAINVLGFIDDVRPFVQRAAVFVAPIRSGSGTKIKVLNAMAQAKPVVATTVAAEGIEVTDGLNILLADDPLDFAGRITFLLNNKEVSERIGNNARSLIESRYSWKVISETIFRIYQDLPGKDNE
ncbi:MAG: glycosyltransferase [Deltaproteobacteria bacterium]|nr:glycosyltransferase [Deltaproteobacteria bacterium]